MVCVPFCRACQAARLWLLCSVLVAAAGTQAADYLANLWQTEDGLPDSSVYALAQTPDGYLWVGTRNGLARFDGTQFRTFDSLNTPELEDGRIRHLFTDIRGTLWIALLDGGMASWRQGTFHRELPASPGLRVKSLVGQNGDEVLFALLNGELLRGSPSPSGALEWKRFKPPGPATRHWYAADNQGTILCATAEGQIFRLEGNALAKLSETGLEGTNLFGLATSSDGRIWTATEKQLAFWEGKRFRWRSPVLNQEATLASNSPPLSVPLQSLADSYPEFYGNGLLAGRDNRLWVRFGGWLREYREGQWVAELGHSAIPLEEFENLSAVCPDSNGGLWSFGRALGLFHLSREGKVQKITTAPKILSSERINALFQDREGNLWLGLENAGLAQLRKPRFALLGADKGLASLATTSVCVDRADTLWVGTINGGLNSWASNRLSAFRVRDDIKSVVCDRQGRLWCATGAGLQQFENGHFRHPFRAASQCDIRAMMEDRQGRLWFGANKTLACWDGQKDTWFDEQGFAPARALCFAEDPEGCIWIGTDAGELRCYREGKFSIFRPDKSRPSAAIWALLAEPDGTLWAGTRGGGLLHFDRGRFTRITSREGLPNDVICSITDDGCGCLWFSSHAGIFRIARSMLNSFIRGEVSVVTALSCGKQDGLPTLECSGGFQPAACRGRDGGLWFATARGVVSVKPQEIVPNHLPPPVIIEAVLVDGKPAAWAGADGLSARLSLGPGQFLLEVKYTGLSFTASDKVRFKNRLLGLDKHWYFAGDRRSVSYHYLPPGDYDFQVTACNSDGVWNETGATLSVSVQPYLWQRKSFQAFAVFGLIAGAVTGALGVARQRTRRRIERLEREQALEKERARVARDLHDDLGAGLTEIGLFGALAQREDLPPERARRYLGQITDKSRELVTSLDEIVWSVNPKHDSVVALGNYFCDYAQQLLQLLPMRCRMEVVEPLPVHPLNAEQRHNLLLAFKEALTNVIRHSQATEVRIRIAVEENMLQVIIADDGRGTAGTLGATTADGLANMSRRLAEIGGRCVVESELARGTVVRFVLPLSPVPNL